jgi:sec-independent protein translocase protein TatA
MSNLGPAELIIVAIVALVLFGNKKLGELARGLGESNKEFKKIKKEIQEISKEE